MCIMSAKSRGRVFSSLYWLSSPTPLLLLLYNTRINTRLVRSVELHIHVLENDGSFYPGVQT